MIVDPDSEKPEVQEGFKRGAVHSFARHSRLEFTDLSFAGGFATGSNIFKALAIGTPYAKRIFTGRAMMILGYLGASIEGVLYSESAVTGIKFIIDVMDETAKKILDM